MNNEKRKKKIEKKIFKKLKKVFKKKKSRRTFNVETFDSTGSSLVPTITLPRRCPLLPRSSSSFTSSSPKYFPMVDQTVSVSSRHLTSALKYPSANLFYIKKKKVEKKKE